MIGGGQRSAHRMVLFLGGRTEETVKKVKVHGYLVPKSDFLVRNTKNGQFHVHHCCPFNAIDPMPMGDANAAERSEITAIASGGGVF